jgi:uncharacterized membrane protein
MIQLTSANTAPNTRVFDRPITHSRFTPIASFIGPSALFALLCFTRFSKITNQSLWYDEGYTFSLASASTFRQFLHIFGSYTTSEHLQPLYYGLIFLWSRIAGTSDFALRLPSALFSIASGAIVCYLASEIRRFGNLLPLLTLAAYVFSSYSIYYAQEARPYALLQMLSFLALALWIERRKSPSRYNVVFAIVCSLCLLGSPFTALLIFSLAVTDLLTRIPLRETIRAWRIPAGFSATIFCAYVALYRSLSSTFVAHDGIHIKQPLWMNFGYSLYGLFYGTTLQPSGQLLRNSEKLRVALHFWPVILPSAFVILAFAATVFLLLRSSRNLLPATRALVFATGLYMMLFFGIFGGVGRLNILPRHSCALFSLLFVLTTLCFSQLASSSSHRVLACLIAALCGYFLINLISIHDYHSDSAFRKDDYRAAAQMLKQVAGPPAFMPAGQSSLMRHYGVEVIDASQIDPQDLAAFLRGRSRNAPEIRIVMNEYRGFRWDKSVGVIPVLAPTYRCVEEQHLSYMNILSCYLQRGEAKNSASNANEASPRTAREAYAH